MFMLPDITAVRVATWIDTGYMSIRKDTRFDVLTVAVRGTGRDEYLDAPDETCWWYQEDPAPDPPFRFSEVVQTRLV